jgi:acyl carrier protein
MTVEEIFGECFDVATEQVHNGIQYQGIEKWDSLNHLKFTSRLEEAYDIELDMDDIINMSSVKKIKDILQKYGVAV